MSSEYPQSADVPASERDVAKIMTAFTAALARMDRDPREAARIQALADQTDRTQPRPKATVEHSLGKGSGTQPPACRPNGHRARTGRAVREAVLAAGGVIRPSRVPGIILKVGFPFLIGLITLSAANFGGMQVQGTLELAAIVTFGAALILFVVDAEIRISAVDERVTAGFAQSGRLAELSARIERSSLGPTVLTDFLEVASQVDERVNPLLQRLARREVERVTMFARQLKVGSEIPYDGEDREWLLGLTQEAESSIDAISLPTMDAGVVGLDGGLWTSDLGIRYLVDQRKAIAREVRIRRIFVVECKDMTQDESFLQVTQMQRNAGVQVRMLDQKLIPDYLQSMIFDFTIFDGIVSYETAAGTPFTMDRPRPGTLRTRLAPEPKRVDELRQRFEQLWERADPERQIGG